MGIITYIKIGAVGLTICVCGYFVWNYQHLKSVNAALTEQNQQLQEANAYYESQPEIDKRTQEINNEIQQAVNAGDVNRVRELYERLRNHNRSKSETPGEAGDE